DGDRDGRIRFLRADENAFHHGLGSGRDLTGERRGLRLRAPGLQQSGANDRNDEQMKSHDRLPRETQMVTFVRATQRQPTSIPVIVAPRKDVQSVFSGPSPLLEPAK